MQIKNNKKNVFVVGSSLIIPGINSLKSDVWRDMQTKFPKISRMLVAKELEVVSADDEGGGESAFSGDRQALEDLSGFNEKTSIKIVNETTEIGTLRLWYDMENREPIKNAINDKIRQLESSDGKRKNR